MSSRTPAAITTACVIGLFVLAGCGSDGGSDAEPSITGTAADMAAPADTGTADTGTADTGPADTASPDTASPDTGGTTNAAAALTGAQICERLSTGAVAADLGLDVTAAVPDDSATPQCAYEYTSDSGGTSNLTVAVMRPEDVGGRTGVEAFDFTLGVNRAFAADDEQEVAAGDGAFRLSGSGIQVGVVLIGDQVYTLLVPGDDAEPTAVEALIATMATTLG